MRYTRIHDKSIKTLVLDGWRAALATRVAVQLFSINTAEVITRVQVEWVRKCKTRMGLWIKHEGFVKMKKETATSERHGGCVLTAKTIRRTIVAAKKKKLCIKSFFSIAIGIWSNKSYDDLTYLSRKKWELKWKRGCTWWNARNLHFSSAAWANIRDEAGYLVRDESLSLTWPSLGAFWIIESRDKQVMIRQNAGRLRRGTIGVLLGFRCR